MRADLHIHTTASDGTDSPAEVVLQAKSIGLGAIAITDHDTVEGIHDAVSAGQMHHVEVVPGIELGAHAHGEEVHILGYYIDLSNQLFLEKLKFFQSRRVARMEKMIERLQEMGYYLDMEQVTQVSGSGSVGRPHLAAAMVKMGAVATTAEAFAKYIGAGCPAYVPRYKLEPVEAVRLIRMSGGVPVLAHPGLNSATNFLSELISAGLKGIEAYHPAHTREQASYYHRLAINHNLIVTGGSDYHGLEHKAGSRLGMQTVPCSIVGDLREKIVL